MGFFGKIKKDKSLEEGFLAFDNFQFKLAVVQVLMYEKGLLGTPYNGGDQYFDEYADVADVTDEIAIERLKPYIEKGTHFFEELQIPCSFANEVTEIYVGEELDVYYHINPQWIDYDDFFEDGKDFDIVDISEAEIRQFPKLKSITFNMFHEPPMELVEKLQKWDIEVNI